MNKPKTEFICVYILQTMKNLLFVCLFFHLIISRKLQHFPRPHPNTHHPSTAVFGLSFFLSFFPSLLLFCFHKFCTRHLCLLLLFSNFSCPFSFKSANKQKAKCLINAYVLYSPHLFPFWEIKLKKKNKPTPHAPKFLYYHNLLYTVVIKNIINIIATAAV